MIINDDYVEASIGELPLKVYEGSIYDTEGNIVENLGVIIDRAGGLLKYGDSVRWLEGYYNSMIDAYSKAGVTSMVEDLVFIKFNIYDGILTLDEMCTLVNFMVMCSCTGAKVMNILMSDYDSMHTEISLLHKIGY